LNELAAGQWSGRINGERSRCIRSATLQSQIAMADLEEAGDRASIVAARQRLETADRRLAALPAFEHEPTFQFVLARSIADELKQAPATEPPGLRRRGEQAFREALRLKAACFCNQLADGFAKLAEVYLPAAGDSEVP